MRASRSLPVPGDPFADLEVTPASPDISTRDPPLTRHFERPASTGPAVASVSERVEAFHPDVARTGSRRHDQPSLRGERTGDDLDRRRNGDDARGAPVRGNPSKLGPGGHEVMSLNPALAAILALDLLRSNVALWDLQTRA